MDAVSLISQFQSITDATFEFEPGGQVTLEFADGVEVSLQHDIEFDLLYIHRTIGTMPTDILARYLMLERVLLANGFDPSTRAASIAYDPEVRHLIMIAKLEVRWATAEQLVERVTQLLEDSTAVTNSLASVLIKGRESSRESGAPPVFPATV
ncbi:Tir chaperone protein (CesT) [compost metagenome]